MRTAWEHSGTQREPTRLNGKNTATAVFSTAFIRIRRKQRRRLVTQSVMAETGAARGQAHKHSN